MATGRSNQLTKQLGEYLTACELARRGLLVATFSGNVPDFDLVAIAADGRSVPIQVKTIRGGSWVFSLDTFAPVHFEGDRQILGSKLVPNIPHLLYVLVLATTYGQDRFFVLEWEQLQELVLTHYRAWLAAKGGVRPRNPKSLHCSALPEQLGEFEGQWDTITRRLRPKKGKPSPECNYPPAEGAEGGDHEDQTKTLTLGTTVG